MESKLTTIHEGVHFSESVKFIQNCYDTDSYTWREFMFSRSVCLETIMMKSRNIVTDVPCWTHTMDSAHQMALALHEDISQPICPGAPVKPKRFGGSLFNRTWQVQVKQPDFAEPAPPAPGYVARIQSQGIWLLFSFIAVVSSLFSELTARFRTVSVKSELQIPVPVEVVHNIEPLLRLESPPALLPAETEVRTVFESPVDDVVAVGVVAVPVPPPLVAVAPSARRAKRLPPLRRSARLAAMQPPRRSARLAALPRVVYCK